MPCWQIVEIAVEFKASNFNLLEEAIKELGWNYSRGKNQVTVHTSYGSFTIVNNQVRMNQDLTNTVNQLKKKYSELVVKSQFKKKGYSFRKETRRGKQLMVFTHR